MRIRNCDHSKSLSPFKQGIVQIEQGQIHFRLLFLLQDFLEQRHCRRAVQAQRMLIQRIQHRDQAGQVAPPVAQQILRDFRRQHKTERAGMLRQRLGFFFVAQAMHLIHQTPSQTGTQIVAQFEMQRGFLAADQQHAAAVAHLVIEIEQLDLRRIIKLPRHHPPPRLPRPCP